jgi:hypothetical protein
MDNHIFKLYLGVNAHDGSLALPSAERGVAQYNNVFWVHRAWNSGWLNLKVDDSIVVTTESTINYYKVAGISELPYGVYPSHRGFYIATCMSTDGKDWTNIQLFELKLQRTIVPKETPK